MQYEPDQPGREPAATRGDSDPAATWTRRRLGPGTGGPVPGSGPSPRPTRAPRRPFPARLAKPHFALRALLRFSRIGSRRDEPRLAPQFASARNAAAHLAPRLALRRPISFRAPVFAPGSRRDSRPVAGRKVRSARSCRIACSLFGVEFVDCSRLEAYFSSRRSARPLQTQSAPRRRRRRRPGGGPGLEPAGGARPQSNAVRRITTMSANRSQFVSSLESKASAHNQTQSARRRRRRRRRRPGGCVRVCVRARCAACFGCVRA